MKESQDRILIVENDPIIRDFISRQALQAAGYQVVSVADASAAITQAIQISPDVIISNLELPGLSGKDLLVALSSQGMNIPVILTARKGMEGEIIQAFRLGAADYLIWPTRETEILAAVERNLKQVREKREREYLAHQLQRANQELHQKGNELSTIIKVGKEVTSITAQANLLDKILSSVSKATQTDLGWFMLRNENSKAFLLAAQHNLPVSLPVRLNQPWDDGISPLVAVSGEPLCIHGAPLKRFKISNLGKSALIVPVKTSREVIGLLTLVRREANPYTEGEQHLVEAIADFASISLVNARLFRVMEERVQQLQVRAEKALLGEKISYELHQKGKKELHSYQEVLQNSFNHLINDSATSWSITQRQEIAAIQGALFNLNQLMEAISPMQATRIHRTARRINLNNLVRQTVNQFLVVANPHNLALVSHIPSKPVFILGDEGLIIQALNSLVSNAIKYSNPGGQVRVYLEIVEDRDAHITVIDGGIGIDPRELTNLFDQTTSSEQTRSGWFSGFGVGLPLVKEIISRQNGTIWAERNQGQGASFHLTFPTA